MRQNKFYILLAALVLFFGITLWANNYIGKTAREANVSYFIDTTTFAGFVEADTAIAFNFNEYETYIINGWATWCKPCLKEIPDLNELVKKHGKAYNKFLALTAEDAEEVEEFIRKRKKKDETFEFNYSQLYEQKKFINYLFSINPSTDIRMPATPTGMEEGFRQQGIPLNLIIHKGKILFYEMGYSKENIKKMDEILTSQE